MRDWVLVAWLYGKPLLDTLTLSDLGLSLISLIELMTLRKTIKDFQDDLEGPVGTGDLGPHGGGHFTIG